MPVVSGLVRCEGGAGRKDHPMQETTIMNTRRELTMALLGLPVLAGAAAKPQDNPYSEAVARVISYTLYAEARGESVKGKMAVAAVIQTRARRAGMTLVETCLQDRQFSCWNGLAAVPEFYISGTGIQPADLKARSDSFSVAWVLMTSTRKWAYLTHFYNPAKASPAWAGALQGRRVIDNHVFGYID